MLIGPVHVPGPREFSRDSVECADDTRRFADELSIGDPAADNDLAAHDGGRRADIVISADDVAEAFLEIDCAVQAEISTRLAAVGINRNQPGVDRRGDNALGAWPGRPGGRVVADAPASSGRRGLDLRIILPAARSTFGIERDHDVVRGTQIDGIVDHQRRSLETHACACQNTGAVGPGRCEFRHILLVDLGKRRKARATEHIAIVRPFS